MAADVVAPGCWGGSGALGGAGAKEKESLVLTGALLPAGCCAVEAAAPPLPPFPGFRVS